LSRIGKVAAATTATTLIEAFKADLIELTCVAGGLADGVKVGDVVVANGFVQHDMDASPLFPRYQVPLYGRHLFASDALLNAIFLEAINSMDTWANAHFLHKFPQKMMKAHVGLIASGDRFVSGVAESQALQSALRSAGLEPLAVEMEGAAVAQVCYDYGIPFAAMRTISDRADDQAHVDFPKFVKEVASHYALAIMDGFMRRLPAAGS
jgi:adenosylhomocysteine nucleosidase